jgi:hypothetical protein
VQYLYGISSTTGVAVHTAIAFLLLGAGYFVARHESNHEAVFFSRSAGGTAARWLSPVAILLPLTLGWFRVAGERAGLYDSAGGAALMMVLMIALFTTLIGFAARALHRTDLALWAASAARERTIAQLQQTLEEVQTLRGLLPICAWCKKIRNETGDWKELAAYVTDHTAASVTHGICPECARTHFGECERSLER